VVENAEQETAVEALLADSAIELAKPSVDTNLVRRAEPTREP
jgi:hypothetical protein